MAERHNSKSKRFQIPAIVTDEIIRDNHIKKEDITWRLIGDSKCRVVMVDATEAEYRAYMASAWAEIKRKDRDSRCMIPGKSGRRTPRPKCNNCENGKKSSEE